MVVQSDHIYVLGVLLCYVHIFVGVVCVRARAWLVLSWRVCAGITYSVMCELSSYGYGFMFTSGNGEGEI